MRHGAAPFRDFEQERVVGVKRFPGDVFNKEWIGVLHAHGLAVDGDVQALKYTVGRVRAVVDDVARECGVQAPGELHRAGAALVDLVALCGEIRGFRRQYPENAASEEPAVLHIDSLAAEEFQHRAGAHARAQGVVGGEAAHRDVPAVIEPDHVRVAGHRLDTGAVPARADDGEVFHSGDYKAGAVVHLVPVVILAAVGAIARRHGQVIQPPVQINGGVRRDGGKEFVHGGDVDLPDAVRAENAVEGDLLRRREARKIDVRLLHFGKIAVGQGIAVHVHRRGGFAVCEDRAVVPEFTASHGDGGHRDTER